NVNGAASPICPGFVTPTLAAPTVATSAAAIVAATSLLLTTVVGRALPFHCTVAPLRKSVPVTVRFKPPLPARAEAGLNAVGCAAATAMVNVATAVDCVGTTLTVTVPVCATSAAA